MSTLKSIFTAILVTGLVGGAAFAASNTITVNLPQAVNVGQATLASGRYSVTESTMADGSGLFVFRSDKGEAIGALAMKSADSSSDRKTELILSNEGGRMHLDKIFIGGESTGFQFSSK